MAHHNTVLSELVKLIPAKTIAQIYQSRWQVELFFKWIKQNLKIKSFVGTSKSDRTSQRRSRQESASPISSTPTHMKVNGTAVRSV